MVTGEHNNKPDFEDEEAIEELYKFSKGVYEDELGKYSRLDDKATKYLSVLSVLIGVFSLLGKQVFGGLIPPENFTQTVILLFAILLFFGLVCSSYLLFKVLNFQEIKKVLLNDDTIIFFKSYSKHQILEAISVDYKEATLNNEKCTNKKVKALTKAYKSIAVTAIFLFMFIVGNIINEWNYDLINNSTGSRIMSDKNTSSKAEKTEGNHNNKSTEKNASPSVVSPGLKLSLENYDVSKSVPKENNDTLNK